MKICWDNLEGLKYNKKTGCWLKKGNKYIYKESCKNCNEPYLISPHNKGKFCSKSCANTGGNHPMYGRKHTKKSKKKISKSCRIKLNLPEIKKKISDGNKGRIQSQETRKKISDGNKGKIISEETKNKMKENHANISGKLNPKWKGGVKEKGLPLYNTFAHQIEWCESVRPTKDKYPLLQVNCTWCGKWFIPKLYNTQNRIRSLNNKNLGEARFYCSNGCKENCPVYGKSPATLMKEDAIKAGRLSWLELPREVQPDLRKMVFERDKYQCIKCGSNESLHCHHLEGIRWNPLESADVDACITVCKDCHKEIHQKEGCKYNELQCKEI